MSETAVKLHQALHQTRGKQVAGLYLVAGVDPELLVEAWILQLDQIAEETGEDTGLAGPYQGASPKMLVEVGRKEESLEDVPPVFLGMSGGIAITIRVGFGGLIAFLGMHQRKMQGGAAKGTFEII